MPCDPEAEKREKELHSGGRCIMSENDKAADLHGLLSRNIKDVIADHPAVGTILSEFNIACVSCAAGNCLFKDIVGVHALPPEQESAMYARVAQAVFPGQTVELPKPKQKPPASAGKSKFSPPIQELVDEHTHIKRVIAAVPAIVASIGAGLDESSRATISAAVDFIKNFADRYHHAKEEDLLFKYFDEGEPILLAMHQEHEDGRAHVRAVLAGLERDDAAAVREHLSAYAELLTEHIRKEDEILYPWMDQHLSDGQIGRLFSEFRKVDTKFGDGPSLYRARAIEIEEKYNKKGRNEI